MSRGLGYTQQDNAVEGYSAIDISAWSLPEAARSGVPSSCVVSFLFPFFSMLVSFSEYPSHNYFGLRTREEQIEIIVNAVQTMPVVEVSLELCVAQKTPDEFLRHTADCLTLIQKCNGKRTTLLTVFLYV